MSRRIAHPLGFGLAVAVLLFIPLFLVSGSAYGQRASQSLAVDVDPRDAPCTNIHRTRAVRPGEDFQVAICLQNAADTVGLFQMDIVYDDTVLTAPEVADTGSALDDNPDANQVGLSGVASGDTGWDCTGFTVLYPKGDKEPATGPGNGVGFIVCYSIAGPYAVKRGQTLPLATMRFQALAPGESTIELRSVAISNDVPVETGSCNPPVDVQMPCNGGSITVESAPPATATPPGAGPTAAAPGSPGAPPAGPTGAAGTVPAGATTAPGPTTAAEAATAAGRTPVLSPAAAATATAVTAAIASGTPPIILTVTRGEPAGSAEATAAAATVSAGGGSPAMRTAVAQAAAAAAAVEKEGGGTAWWLIAVPVVVLVGVAAGGVYWLRFRRT